MFNTDSLFVIFEQLFFKHLLMSALGLRPHQLLSYEPQKYPSGQVQKEVSQQDSLQ